MITALTAVLEKIAGNNQPREPYRHKLTQIVVDKWSADRSKTAKQYRSWKKHILGVAQQYGLKQEETAFVIQLNCVGQAKILLDIFEVEDFQKPDILQQVWHFLDAQHEELEHVRTDDAYTAWERAHRKHGSP